MSWGIGAVLSILACGNTDSDIPPATIETVSQRITFDSVSRLGPHNSIASIQRSDTRGNDSSFDTTESIELAWNSWDSFHFQRSVDGEPTFEAINHQGSSASRNGRGRWKSAFDGEAARLDVYTAWNAWDEALSGFTKRIVFTDEGATVVDGRPARTFSVSLGPIPDDEPRRKSGVVPHRLEGTVTLDDATAVRLRTEVLAVSKSKKMVRRVLLNIRRSGIGETQSIEAPEVPIGTPGDLLRTLPTRPNKR